MEASRRDASNGYQQHMFALKIKETGELITSLSWGPMHWSDSCYLTCQLFFNYKFLLVFNIIYLYVFLTILGEIILSAFFISG